MPASFQREQEAIRTALMSPQIIKSFPFEEIVNRQQVITPDREVCLRQMTPHCLVIMV
jgi:hypothetical protein